MLLLLIRMYAKTKWKLLFKSFKIFKKPVKDNGSSFRHILLTTGAPTNDLAKFLDLDLKSLTANEYNFIKIRHITILKPKVPKFLISGQDPQFQISYLWSETICLVKISSPGN